MKRLLRFAGDSNTTARLGGAMGKNVIISLD